MRRYTKLTFEQLLEEMYGVKVDAAKVLFSGEFSREASSREIVEANYEAICERDRVLGLTINEARVLSDDTLVAYRSDPGGVVEFFIGRPT